MRLEPRPHRKGEIDLPLLFSGLLVLWGLLGAGWLLAGLPVPPCGWKVLTGLPCPTCGATRMARAAMALRPLEAFAWNPLLFLAIGAILASGLVCGARRLLGLPRLRVVTEGPAERAALRAGAVAALVLGWVYLVLRGV